MKHWKKFARCFHPMVDEVSRKDGRSMQLSKSQFVFMRWKEVFFVNNEASGLTIAGFYYGEVTVRLW